MFRSFTNESINEPQGISRQQLRDLERQSTQCSEDQEGQSCPICLEVLERDNQIIHLECGHFFHKNCILRWYTEHHTCPVCRSGESEQPTSSQQTHTIRVPLEQLLMMSTQISLIFYYPNNLRQVTRWNTHSTIVELFQYISKSCSSQNANLQLSCEDNIFKTTESFSYLNQSLLIFNITSRTEFIISFF